MQHFQSILIVIGLLAIGGVLVHGYLLSRKEKMAIAASTPNVDIFAEKSSSEPIDETGDDILGEVRIISNSEESTEENIDFTVALNDEKVDPVEFTEVTSDDAIENMDAIENIDTVEIITPADDEIEEQPVLQEAISEPSQVNQEKNEVVQPQDLFIFNVVAKDDLKLGGHELLQFFLTSGFRFGEMSIFHRHEHSDGNGPVLFSIANMMAPGVFDPENMEQFKSEGVSFFLTAPNEHIDIQASFEMMLRAVQQMADEFDCIVLNADREPMTEEQFIEYNHRLLHYI